MKTNIFAFYGFLWLAVLGILVYVNSIPVRQKAQLDACLDNSSELLKVVSLEHGSTKECFDALTKCYKEFDR